jgi:hypothetical protein
MTTSTVLRRLTVATVGTTVACSLAAPAAHAHRDLPAGGTGSHPAAILGVVDDVADRVEDRKVAYARYLVEHARELASQR